MKAELEIKEFLKAINEFYTLCSQNLSAFKRWSGLV